MPSTNDEALYQLTLERLCVGSLFVFMWVAAVSFLLFPNLRLYQQFSSELHTLILPTFFFALSIGGVCIAPALVVFRDRLTVIWKRQLFILSISPIALYTVAVGIFSLETGGMGFGVVIYILFIVPYLFLPLALYRGS